MNHIVMRSIGLTVFLQYFNVPFLQYTSTGGIPLILFQLKVNKCVHRIRSIPICSCYIGSPFRGFQKGAPFLPPTNISVGFQVKKHATCHHSSFLSIKKTSQIVRNDCKNIQQHVLTKRIINMRKKKEIQIFVKGRGRLMLAAQFPELPLLLEYAFGDHNTH